MSSFNVGNEFRTKVSKGKIEKYEYVKVSHPGDWENFCTVIDLEGNEEIFRREELTRFGILEKINTSFDIVEDFYGKTDTLGNKDFLLGLVHLTENVRSGPEHFKFWQDCRYSGNLSYGISYKYKYRELTDKEIVDILLNEILYGVNPGLQSTSCVGTTAKGIDKDPNYHDGTYRLPNEKDYTITYCRDTVKIREGIDGGWYSGRDSEKLGRTIYEGKVDYTKIKEAKIKKHAISMLNNYITLFSEIPEIEQILIDHVKSKNLDRFKLSSEFES